MLVFKIIAIALCCSFVAFILKSMKSELSLFVLLSGAVLILMLILNSLGSVVGEINLIVSKTEVSSEIIKMLFKVVGVGFLCEFASNICFDVGASNLGECVLIGGRVAIIVLCFPVIKSLLTIISGLV